MATSNDRPGPDIAHVIAAMREHDEDQPAPLEPAETDAAPREPAPETPPEADKP